MKKTTSKTKTTIDPRQIDIFAFLRPEEPPAPGSLDIGIPLRHAISQAIRTSGMDRIDICAAIYKLTGKEVPKSSLDNWSAESRDKSSDNLDFNGNKGWGMPAEVLHAFCRVTNCYEPLFIVAEACNYRALKGKDVVRARLGLLKEEQKKIGGEIKRLEEALVNTEERE
ncbi:MAG: hypothetical protein HY760_00430 [Nitrospirae bacterium]|nr:hypothetical protein [Nitrospirota bacterium]